MIINRFNYLRLFSTFTKRPFNKSSQQNKSSQTVFQSFSNQINQNKDVFNQYKKQIQKDSILKKFRRDVFKKQQISQELKAYQQDIQKQGTYLQDMLNKGSKQDVIKYSKKIMEKVLNKKKIFKQRTLNPVFSDYGDYSSYRTNYAKIQDQNLGEIERLDRNNAIQNSYKFIDSLPDEFLQKDNIREHIKSQFQHSHQNISISEYGKLIQQRYNKDLDHTQGKQLDYEIYRQNQQRSYRTLKQYWEEKEISEERISDLENKNPYRVGRLSPQAMDTIYQCYLQGWTVRDISRRFGIMPKRTKFCIWARAQLYDQFLPKYGWKYYYQALQKELQLGEQDGYVDYGLDLDYLQTSRMPQTIVEWNQNRVDSQRKPEQYTYSLQKLEKMKKFNRHQKVQVGTHGKQNKMYLLKQWTIFRGKGSNEYYLRNNTFRKLSKAQIKMVKQYY